MKMVFCDIDGTLYRENEQISPLNKEALTCFHDAGGQVVYCTGRHILEMNKILEQDGYPFDYLVLNNGGAILDSNKETLYEKHIEQSIGLNILQWGVDANMFVHMCDGKNSYGCFNHQSFAHSDMGNIPIPDDYMTLMKKSPSFQIISLNQEDNQTDQINIIKKRIEDKYGDDVECHPNLHFLDIVPNNCSKGSGVTYLKDKTNAITYTIGDSWNDLSMIEAGDHGCTFNYAHDDIQEKADHIYSYVYEMIDDILGGKI